MNLPERMTFGIFLGPFHRVGENPTFQWAHARKETLMAGRVRAIERARNVYTELRVG